MLPDAHTLSPPHLQHQFETMVQQEEASTLGMWVFLVTEILFFGGVFTVYAVYRNGYPRAFTAASSELHVWLATINTVVLITSSFSMVLAVRAAQTGARRLVPVLLMATFVLGSVFLGIKAVEYYKEFLEHHVPGLSFQFEKEYFRQAQLFYLLYFVMTALHAVHMVIGMGVILAMVWMSWRGRFSPDYYTPLEVTGLYWHFVDVVWIFLFPLLYLIGRHGGT